MRRIREVLRLRAELGPNVTAISAGAKLARSTVRAYLERAAAAGLDAASADGLSETALGGSAFPSTVRGPCASIARLGRRRSGNCGASST